MGLEHYILQFHFGSPTIAEAYIYDYCMVLVSDSYKVTSAFLSGPGQTHHILSSAEDRIVLSNEDITQDPQAVASIAEAGTAAIIRRLWERISRRF